MILESCIGGGDGALRRPRPRSRADGTCVERGSIPLVAPLHAALHGAARRVPPLRFMGGL